jgi:hypothetical protein
MVCLSPSVVTDRRGGPGWAQKLGWAADACITMKAFSGEMMPEKTERIH